MAELDAQLARVWDTHRAEIDARVARIDAAVAQLGDGTLGDDARDEARHAAHQLAGTCGTFGFGEASEHAAALELSLTGAPSPGDAARLTQLAAAMRAALPKAQT
jgi:HPt (histidine-containing phosphotransfer) domain-containing protein